jgi:DHA2 family multidrug resistance protein
MPAANASAMRQVEPAMLAFAAPAATFLTQTGGALGVASLSVLLQERAAFHVDAMLPMMTEHNGAAMAALDALRADFLTTGLAPSAAEQASHQQLAASMWRSAQVLAFRDCFYAIALAFATLFLVIPLIPEGRTPRKSQQKAPAPTSID